MSGHQGFYCVIIHPHNEKTEGDGNDILKRDLIKKTFSALIVLPFFSVSMQERGKIIGYKFGVDLLDDEFPFHGVKE